MGKYYLTTPIYYVNDKPHIGHTYTTIVADVIKRYRTLRGDEVFLLTGTDENSQKNVEAAEKAGEKDIQAYLDKMAGVWESTWKELGIDVDHFIRTTDDRHRKGVEKFWNAVYAKGDIYQGEYEGLYCVGCEAFYKESDLVDGKCPIHKKEVSVLKEKNWFFKLKNYREALLKLIDENEDFVQPASRRNEIRSYIDKFMEDVSISRESVKWGIPVPNDPGSVIYVWFDALINYLTGVGYGTDDAMFDKWWPAELHLVGKDIIKFHCALWPAMLMSAGLPLPKKVFAHGYFTVNGEKMSKSLGNAIDPKELVATYGIDTLRWFLLSEIPFGNDGDFSTERLMQSYKAELGNTVGNLFYRVLSMTEKYFEGRAPAKYGTEKDYTSTWDGYDGSMDKLDFFEATRIIRSVAFSMNALVDVKKPWELAKTDQKELGDVIYHLLEELRRIAWHLKPIMPGIAEKMLVQLGVVEQESTKSWEEAKIWGGIQEGTAIAKGEPLFPRLEEKKAE